MKDPVQNSDDFDERLERDSRFIWRVEQARESLRAGRGIRLEELEAKRAEKRT
jgi:hypothetical protein